MEERLPNVHFQRAAGDGNAVYAIEIDGERINDLKDGRFTDTFVPKGVHTVRIFGGNAEEGTRVFKVTDERKKLHFFVRGLFGKIDIVLIGAKE